MRRIFLVLSVMAMMLLTTAGVALAATYTYQGTSGDDIITVYEVNKRPDVINVYCGAGTDHVDTTTDWRDTVNLVDCETWDGEFVKGGGKK